ncbi:MAG TPA: N-acyl homoserine lactonase family protein [Phototrophicaceae bacterium]|jgi:N-acyl homoserine lactone hydrolase|nr:N-acyl homoserine lactonase family protein [Phototrophicaceae bacterium]
MTTAPSLPVRLYLMQVATVPGRNIPIVCYLVQTGDGTNILIDSGLAPTFQLPPGMPAPIMYKNVIEQLAEIGLTPDDIHLFICTHFDGDHAGNNDLFQKSEFIVQRAHYDNALINPRFAVSRLHWDQPSLNYRFIDGDMTLLPGLDLIETSGHTTGHQSVLVRLPETGTVLLAIDAVTVQSAFTQDRQAGPMDENEEALRTSTRKLLDLAQRENAALVVFGHDGEQWETLRKLPDCYS